MRLYNLQPYFCIISLTLLVGLSSIQQVQASITGVEVATSPGPFLAEYKVHIYTTPSKTSTPVIEACTC